MRLNKFIAEQTGVSRREADDLIAAGKVSVGERVAKLGERFTDGDKVFLDGVLIVPKTAFTYIMLNKPVGYVSSRKAQDNAPTLYELLPDEYKLLKTVGRLDKESSGLILLTDDGDFTLQMTHPKFEKVKVYEATLDQPLAPLHQQMLADFGIELPDGLSKLGLAEIGEGRKKWQVTMHEGRNRQIRRSFGALGYTVVALHRTDFGKYHLSNLESGKIRKLDFSSDV
ncbi:MAG: rRNA pseudouridine synthase [Candidatus Nomurabacteria bacterium]|jgi:23S rRNA pseudouridine2605 synthase|nr:rRNA pseudouridine synthase [Candidatus Nomurabacteria bacterium]